MSDQLALMRLFVEQLMKAVIAECGLTIQVLPQHLLSNRVALTHYLAEQLHNLGQYQIEEIERRFKEQWRPVALIPKTGQDILVMLDNSRCVVAHYNDWHGGGEEPISEHWFYWNGEKFVKIDESRFMKWAHIPDKRTAAAGEAA